MHRTNFPVTDGHFWVLFSKLCFTYVKDILVDGNRLLELGFVFKHLTHGHAALSNVLVVCA